MAYTKKQIIGGATLIVLGVAGGVKLGLKVAEWLNVKKLQKTQVPVTPQEQEKFWEKTKAELSAKIKKPRTGSKKDKDQPKE